MVMTMVIHYFRGQSPMPKQVITASEFKAKCLQLMDRVAQTGEELIITKHGKAVSKLTPITNKPRSLFGAHRGQIKINGDILAPLDAHWEAMQ